MNNPHRPSHPQCNTPGYPGESNPQTISKDSRNTANYRGHTHEIERATTEQAGIVKLNNTLTSEAVHEALTAAKGKELADRIQELTQESQNEEINRRLEAALGYLSTRYNAAYPTYARALSRVSVLPNNALVYVVNDPDETKNGLYYVDALSLIKAPFDALSTAFTTDAMRVFQSIMTEAPYTELTYNGVGTYSVSTIKAIVEEFKIEKEEKYLEMFDRVDAAIVQINQVKDVAQGSLDDAVQDFNDQGDVVLSDFRDAVQTIVVDDGVPAQAVVVGDSTLDVFAEKVIQNTVSIADMLAVRNPKNGARFAVTGYHSDSLLGGGDFLYVENSILIADNGVVFDCPDGGKWVRLHKGFVCFYDYGAKSDGTDQSIAIENCIANNYCRRIIQDDGEFIVTRTLKKMLPRTDLKMGASAWIKIVSPTGGVRVFKPAGDSTLVVNVDGNQYPLSGSITDEWIGANNRAISSNAEGHGSESDININVKNVTIKGSKFINIAEPIRSDGSQNWNVERNYFENIKQSCCLSGASALSPVINNKFSKNTCINVGDTACATLQLIGHPTAKIKAVQMINNFAMNTQMRTMGWAFDFEGVNNKGDCSDGIISGNIILQPSTTATLDTSARGGVVAGENTVNTLISNNTVVGKGLGAGINANRSFDTTVSNNKIYDFAGGAITIVGSTGSLVSNNTSVNCGGSTVNQPAIAIMTPATDWLTTNFTVEGNTIKYTSEYVRSGNSPAICVQPESSIAPMNLKSTISGNKIFDPNGTGILIQSTNANPISGITLNDNKVISDYAVQSFQISNAENITVDGFYSRGCTRFRISNCLNGVRLKNLDVESTVNAIGLLRSNNVEISDSRLISPNSTYFEDSSQFSDTSKGNKLVRISGTRRTTNKGQRLAATSGVTIAHGIVLTPTEINITPMTADITSWYISEVGLTSFKFNFVGPSTADFMWKAEV